MMQPDHVEIRIQEDGNLLNNIRNISEMMMPTAPVMMRHNSVINFCNYNKLSITLQCNQTASNLLLRRC